MRRGSVRVGIVSTYPPRREGFAEDAGELVRALAPECEVVVCAVGRQGQNYPDEVVAVVATDDLSDYRRAGRVLAEHGVDVVLIRHDDGIYGGPSGSHVLDLAQEVRRQGISVMVSLQSVRPDASAGWTRTIAALTAGAVRVLVPTEAARDAAVARRIAAPDQLRVVPVGVPAAVLGVAHRPPPPPPAGRPETARLLADLAGHRVIITIAPDPPSLLAALPRIPSDVRFVVARPGFAKVPVEDDQVRALVDATELTERVRFVDSHLLTPDLTALFARASAYLAIDASSEIAAPRAVAAGCPVVRSIDDLADALSPSAWEQARLEGAAAAPGLAWPAVGQEVAALLAGPEERALKVGVEPITVPPLQTGWLDHDLSVLRSFEADRDARLAVVAAGLLSLPTEVITPASWGVAEAWASQSVRALGMAVQTGFGDGHRAVWGLGAIAAAPGVPRALRQRAAGLRTLLANAGSGDLAGDADVVLGLAADPGLGEAERAAFDDAVARLDAARRSGPAWPCFGDRLRADDIRLAQALMAAGQRLDDEAMTLRGVESIDWLARRAGLATAEGMFTSPVAGPRRAVEAGAYVEALAAAYTMTGAPRHARMAQQAMVWFHGANRRGEPVYDPIIGACQAGLGSAVNLSDLSAEATLGYLAALVAMLAAGLATMPSAEVSRLALATVA
jgi:hypothetical protein